MNLTEFEQARTDFISQWGTLGSSWGINRTMAQIHALLMIAVDPLPTNEVMTSLKISRGNANSNLRELVDWGLIHRVTYPGDRKEYFEAEKDVWTMFCTIARERKRREIDPVSNLLKIATNRELDEADPAQKLFGEQLRSLSDFVQTADRILGKLAESERSKVMPFLIKRFN